MPPGRPSGNPGADGSPQRRGRSAVVIASAALVLAGGAVIAWRMAADSTPPSVEASPSVMSSPSESGQYPVVRPAQFDEAPFAAQTFYDKNWIVSGIRMTVVGLADTTCDAATGLEWADQIIVESGYCQYGFQARTVLNDGSAAADALVIMTDSEHSAEALKHELSAANGPAGAAVGGITTPDAPPGFEPAFTTLNAGTDIAFYHSVGSVVVLTRGTLADGEPIIAPPDGIDELPQGSLATLEPDERVQRMTMMVVSERELSRPTDAMSH